MIPTNFWKLLFAFFITVNLQTYGQAPNPILSMEVVAIPIGNNLSSDSLPLVTDSTIYQVGMNLSLYDSTNIQSIEVKIGSSESGTEFFTHVFTFDVSGQLGGGLSYARNGYSIQLDLGELVGLFAYYSEVRVQHLNGSYSPSISFNQ